MGIVTTDINELTKLKGYWSDRDVYFNTSNKLVLLTTKITASDVAVMIRDFIDSNLDDWIKGPMAKAMTRYFGKTYVKLPMAFMKYGLHFSKFSKTNTLINQEWFYSPASSLAMTHVVDILQKQGLNLDQIAQKLTEIWLSEYRSNPHKGISPYLPKESVLLYINWNSIGITQTAELLEDLLKLSNIIFSPKQFGIDCIRPSETLLGKTVQEFLSADQRALIDRFSILPVSKWTNSVAYRNICNITAAAEQALLYLVQCDVCLLPFGTGLATNANAIGLGQLVFDHPLLDGPFKTTNYSTGAVRLLASTNMKSLSDFPIGIGEHFPQTNRSVSLASTFTEILKQYALKNGCKEYPYAMLKKRNTVEHSSYTPEWVRANENYSQEWFDFVWTFWQQSKSGDSGKSSVIRNFCRWAVEERDFKTPYDIQAMDLRNPFMDSEEVTYFEYLRTLKDVMDSHRVIAWANGARLYTSVTNSAKLPGSPLFGRDTKNPFDGVESPFSCDSGGFKTARPRMPDTLVEVMIETLLDLDENGVPTYKWVREATATFDTAIVADPEDPTKTIKVWCPSTANCLATLLLTPIRGHQSRWLDQGLMDEFIFDLKTRQMIKNTHPLAQWRYKNGKSHKQQYRRLSGVFQTEHDSMTDTDEFIIWVRGVGS